jgi:hypothetical protein
MQKMGGGFLFQFVCEIPARFSFRLVSYLSHGDFGCQISGLQGCSTCSKHKFRSAATIIDNIRNDTSTTSLGRLYDISTPPTTLSTDIYRIDLPNRFSQDTDNSTTRPPDRIIITAKETLTQGARTLLMFNKHTATSTQDIKRALPNLLEGPRESVQ